MKRTRVFARLNHRHACATEWKDFKEGLVFISNRDFHHESFRSKIEHLLGHLTKETSPFLSRISIQSRSVNAPLISRMSVKRLEKHRLQFNCQNELQLAIAMTNDTFLFLYWLQVSGYVWKWQLSSPTKTFQTHSSHGTESIQSGRRWSQQISTEQREQTESKAIVSHRSSTCSWYHERRKLHDIFAVIILRNK